MVFAIVMDFIAKTNAFANAILRKMEVGLTVTVIAGVMFKVRFYLLDLQCIADMKKECDANGLEYELLMQESTKDRFLREVKTNDLDFNKHIVVLKHKRQSSSNSSDIVGNANPESVSNDIGEGGGASSGLTGLGGLHGGISSLAGELQASKLLVLIRERLESLKSINSIAPIAPVVVPPVVVTTISPRVAAIPFKFSLPEFKKLPALSSLPALSTLSLPALSTLSLPKLPTIEALSDLIVQPGNLVES